MKGLLLLALVAATALLAPSAAKPLIGGTPTGTSSATNVGAFGVIRNGAFSEICSGTLIAPRAVVTAGHCTVYFASLEQAGYHVVFTLDPSPPAAPTSGRAARSRRRRNSPGACLPGGPSSAASGTGSRSRGLTWGTPRRNTRGSSAGGRRW